MEASYSMAFRDTLTGILSRRALDQELLKLGNQYAIAMVDIDHFKKINDQHGHDIGDDVLRMVASILETSAHNCKVFRYGGEEFTVLFPGKKTNEILSVLERMRTNVERKAFFLRAPDRPAKKPQTISKTQPKGSIHVTVSIGAAHSSSQVSQAYDVLKKADTALLQAKSSGRNRVAR
jgi:diguanylate cyclase (GGDEF)-like protein